MGELIQSVKDGVIEQNSKSLASKAPSNQLDKEAFLKLLVTQMQNQDPLEPTTDTEFVSQLATYSQLEELQNLSSTTTNSQALGLVGKNVIIKTLNSSNNEVTFSGVVDFVTYTNGKAELSVNGNLYSIDDLYSVIDDSYLIMQGLPSIETAFEGTYDKNKPSDITFEVNVGEGDTVATQVAVLLNNEVIDGSFVSLNGNKVTISGDAFKNVANGTYKLAVVFNDAYYTTVSDKITVNVTGESSDANGSVSDEDLGELLVNS